MQKRQRSANIIYALSMSAAMTALSVILCRFLGFSPEDSPFRFEIGFLPIAFVAELLGPVWSGFSYLVADIIGSLLSGYAPNPWIIMCKLLTGVFMGLCLFEKIWHKKPSLSRVIFLFASVAVIIDFLLMSPIMMFLYGHSTSLAFSERAINAAINLPIRIVVFYFVRKGMDKPLEQIMKKSNSKSFKSYANSFQAVTVPGLERISALCELLGHPEASLRFIHVAGTNGKGSVCANIASILESAGYKTGKYISPNLIRVNERISVNGREISDFDMNTILAEIEPLCREVESKTGIAPTQFEIWTALAFVYFAAQKCDYVVLEVGLGGEFDATNVIRENAVAVITRLGMDHTQYLGSTLSEVASAKCGIIKESCGTKTLVTAAQSPEAMAVVEERVGKMGHKLLVAKPVSLGNDGMLERFSLDGMVYKTGISGYHQIENAALSVLACRALGVPEEKIREGISRAENPARFELIRDNPPIIYDGGHNENGIEALNLSLDRYFPGREKTVIFACMKDKEIKASLELLSHGKTEFIFTTVKDNPRAMSAAMLADRAKELGFSGLAFEEISEAYKAALSKGKLTVICGSLYLYKDFREFYDSFVN